MRMPTRVFTSIFVAFVWSSFVGAHEQPKIVVFATTPELACVARIVLPEATLHTATTFKQDPHHTDPRPSLIAKIRSADVVLATGGGLEDGWLPTLMEKSGQPFKLIFYSTNCVKLDGQVDGVIAPFDGDVHPHGNPHIHTNPHHICSIVKKLGAELEKSFPAQQTSLRQRVSDFEARWLKLIQQWEKQASSLKDTQIIVQHSSFHYFLKWLGIKQVADIEPKPGFAPTAKHIEKIERVIQKSKPFCIIVPYHLSDQYAQTLSKGHSVPSLVLPATTENIDASEAGEEKLSAWFTHLINALKKL